MSKHGKRLILAISSFAFCLSLSGISVDHDTLFISYPDTLSDRIHSHHAYHQTLTMKLFMSQALYDGKYKTRDNGKQEVFLNCEQALDVIKKIDNLTLGIPKIIYLVGWQYNGHDSKYPAWFEGNVEIKRPGDPSALESIRWLMKEAEKYGTTVSLHINMLDAYEDSPLWETYVKNNIIAKNSDSTLRHCEWGYPLSYAQEWKTGFTKKRIDSLCKILPVQRAGTIHIDAFHSWPPVPVKKANGEDSISLAKGVISPLLGFTPDDETEAQRKIFTYWASKGVDVTSEGVDFLRSTSFEGYQHMAWWFGGKADYYLKWPAAYYCGGMDRSVWGRLFGTSMHGEEIIRKDPEKLEGFKQDFCLKTAVWYYLNRLNRLYLVDNGDRKFVQYSDNVNVSLEGEKYLIKKGEMILVDDFNLFIPALWMDDNKILCYSRDGYKNRIWTLPPDWKGIPVVRLYRITEMGVKEIGLVPSSEGQVVLSLRKDDMILIDKGVREGKSKQWK
jgi:hypothetical protein